MKEIFKNVYHIGDSGCSVFLVDTESSAGLILIDCGMSLPMIKKISTIGLNPNKITHCILTHCHIDHIAICDEENYGFKATLWLVNGGYGISSKYCSTVQEAKQEAEKWWINFISGFLTCT